MLVYFLYGLFFVSCIVLIATVLLQPGKADAGALFTSNISSTAFGPRGTQSVLSRITIGAAICFMLAALLLAMPAISGDISVLNSTGGTRPATTAPASTETDPNANNAVVAPAETNTNTTAAPESATNTNSAANK
jgi:preprotein translocase subunit SecG